jgi:ADP-ribose pyrophosphatase
MWEALESQVLHEGKLTSVRRDVVAGPRGSKPEQVILFGPPISLAVPFLPDGRVVLVKQFRYAWGRLSWECPAGHAEPGESPLECARRELAEETGYRAAKLELLYELYPSAKVSARYSIFRASELTAGETHFDADEELEIKAFATEEIRDFLRRGEIVHGPSVTALLLAGVKP